MDDNVAGLMIWTNAEPTEETTIHILEEYQEGGGYPHRICRSADIDRNRGGLCGK